MPVGSGAGRGDAAGRAPDPVSAAGPRGFNPLALWIAAASPLAATLLLLSRLAA